jgi:hypothetical protein
MEIKGGDVDLFGPHDYVQAVQSADARMHLGVNLPLTYFLPSSARPLLLKLLITPQCQLIAYSKFASTIFDTVGVCTMWR